jgi:hypothetical protein
MKAAAKISLKKKMGILVIDLSFRQARHDIIIDNLFSYSSYPVVQIGKGGYRLFRKHR